MPLPFILGAAAIAAAGYGAKKGYDGYQTKSEAEEITKRAEIKYENAKVAFDSANSESERSLEDLGKLQLKIGSEFTEFRRIADELLEKLNQSSNSKDIKISLPKHKLDKVVDLSISATAYLGQLAGAGAAGAAAAYAVYGGVMALAAASTGTPIAALSGAAAYNAAMAAIGGGALSAGGFGMAGGAMVLGAVVAAPVFAIAGWAYNKHAMEVLNDAMEYENKVDEGVVKLKLATDQFIKIKQYADRIFSSTDDIYKVFKTYFDDLKAIDALIRNKVNIETVEDSVLLIINNGYQVASILTDIITTPFFKIKKDVFGEPEFNDKNEIIIEVDENDIQVLNIDEMKNTLNQAKDNIEQFKQD